MTVSAPFVSSRSAPVAQSRATTDMRRRADVNSSTSSTSYLESARSGEGGSEGGG